MDFRSTHVSSVKKADLSTNFVAGEIINRMTHHNSHCRDKNKHYMTSYMMIYKEMSHAMLLRMREYSPDRKLVA
jgi:hypothetical protein